MYRKHKTFCIGLIAVSLMAAPMLAQVTGGVASSRRDGSQQLEIERVDIYDLLAPLGKVEIDSAAEQTESEAVIPDTTPDVVTSDDSPLIELQSNSSAPITTEPEVVHTAPTETLSERVQIVLAGSYANYADLSRASPYLPATLTNFSQDELRQLVASSSSALHRELAGAHYGERWRKYLRLSQVGALLADPTQGANASSDINSNSAELRAILQSCDRIASDQKFQSISQRHNFAVFYHGLAEYLATPETREERHDAHRDITQLIKSLEPVPTGHQWRDYFETNRVVRLLASPRPLSRDEQGQLQLILSRFETAAVDPQYKEVAKLPGFAQTHQRLRAAVAVVPDAEAVDVTGVEHAELPVAESGGPKIFLSTDQGVAFTRDPSDAQWKYAEGATQLTSGAALKTNEKGIARLLIGGATQVVCSPETVLQVRQAAAQDGSVVTELHIHQGNIKLASRAVPDLSPRTDPTPASARVAIVYKGHRIVPNTVELELDLRQEPRTERVIASVYTGSIVVAHDSGDEVVIRVGREAVMLPAGIAIRAAAKKPDAWWPTRVEQAQGAVGVGATSRLNR